MTTRFDGVFAALTTPLDGGRIDTARLADNVRRYDAFDLAGYLVAGTTGEATALDEGETEALVRAVRAAAAPGRRVIAGASRESTALAIDAARRLAGAGAEAVLVRPPSFLRGNMTPAAYLRFFQELADASPVPVLLYQIPQLTGLAFDGGMVLELAAHPNIAGVKDSSGLLTLVGEVMPRVRTDFSFLMGTGAVLLPGLLLGATGAVLAVADAAPAQCAAIYNLHRQGRLEEALGMQRGLMAIERVTVDRWGVAGLKHALDLLGWAGGEPRPPLPPLDDAARSAMAAALREMGMLKR
jgi:4-hydroxy-2-oxoglutarate aldolase